MSIGVWCFGLGVASIVVLRLSMLVRAENVRYFFRSEWTSILLAFLALFAIALVALLGSAVIGCTALVVEQKKPSLSGETLVILATVIAEAARREHHKLDLDHLVWALFAIPNVHRALRAHGVDVEPIVAELEARLDRLPPSAAPTRASLTYSHALGAAAARVHAGEGFVGALLSAIVESGTGVAELLRAHGVSAGMLDGVSWSIGTRRVGEGDTDLVFHDDEKTPFAFVVGALREQLGLSEEDAIAVAIETHDRGEAIATRTTLDIAQERARAIEGRARAQGLPLRVTTRVAGEATTTTDRAHRAR